MDNTAYAGKSVAFQDVMPLHDVDFVLVWESSTNAEQATSAEIAKEKRQIFEKNLEREGLILEREKLESSTLTFVKIHAPPEVLRRYCEILKLRMPMKPLQGEIVDIICSDYDNHQEYYGSLFQIYQHQTESTSTGNTGVLADVSAFFSMFTSYFEMDTRLFPPKDHKFHSVYSRDKEYLFDVEDPEFFTPLIRAHIVDFILKRKRYSEDTSEDFSFGIHRLLTDGVYFAAYPLHDGDLKNPDSQRYRLWTEWAAIGKCLKYQPLEAVKEYFGVKIGLYFAWLGFYTHMLIPVSILGFICFLYGCFSINQDQPSLDICNKTLSEQIYMCPLCDKLCDYWRLHDTCFYAKLTYLFDNYATVAFAVVMSFWSAIFLENWKRYAWEIRHKWDLSNLDIHDEHPRPEYLARLRLKHVKNTEKNNITETTEPSPPFWKMRLPYTMFSVSMILFLISLAVVAVVAVVIYRTVLVFLLVARSSDAQWVHSWGLILVNSSAACINLVFIFFFNWLYSFLAEYLTELELHRTQTSHDDSLTLKMYLLQFVNYYSSIFYIAFFKGKFVGNPKKSTKFLGYRQEECGPGGCMTELCIQLAIIMVGKQAMNSVLEMLIPIIWKWWGQFKIMTGIEIENKSSIFSTQWAKDVKLLEWGPRSLFPEYLEMVLQYGFVTIFVAAFPLAPLFALLNNILEMRLDAKKLITYYRRPVSQRVKDIGVWYGIMDAIGKIAVISNAFIIAFTSNFIPKLVYMYEKDGTLDGFLDHSLAYFNVSEFSLAQRPLNTSFNKDVEVCRYQQYRTDHLQADGMRYKRTSFYWKVWMARLAFVVVFENVVALCVMTLKWIIPDIPKKLNDKIKRETYVTQEIVIKQEMKRARGASHGDAAGWNPMSGGKEVELVRTPSHSAKQQENQRAKINELTAI
ncbi:unnamed protein product [Allacma fusca]|uniref:Anoctamin n=1 Tax=Allacma fusca TaxID=39272 RepID=A0A8J2JCG2_9HEXA|nr:unnamed protein product [Allacma fusca]